MGLEPSRDAGIPVSVKDVFDVAGDVTCAASPLLDEAPPATADAPVVAQLRAAGFVIVGRTNMTEFAYSVLGVNSHYGTPCSPWDRTTGRIPGGSSSGGAVSITDGMAALAIGSDTGGSCRAPAAFCGIVGFKPTTGRVPDDGMIPLSLSADTAGPIAASVACCAIADSILTCESPSAPEPFPVDGLRLAVPQSLVLDDLEEPVAKAFERSLSKLSAAGARPVDIPFEALVQSWEATGLGRLVSAEAYTVHRPILAKAGDRVDPLIRDRFKLGETMSAADYIEVRRLRADVIERAARVTAPFDAAVWPTTPIVPPPLADVMDPERRFQVHRTIVRNTGIPNFLDRCAISVPCHEPEDAPVGFSLMGERNGDRRLLAIARGVEAVVSSSPGSKA